MVELSCYSIYVRNEPNSLSDKDVLLLGLYDQFSFQDFMDGKEGMVYFNPLLPLVKVTLPCGHSIVYRSLSEIPEESVPCSCGNPNHWFIFYEKGGNNGYTKTKV